MTKSELARYIDQTILKPGMTEDFVRDFCKDASANNFASVCILPTLVPVAAEVLKGTNTKVCTVISFPLGMDVPEVKIRATEESIKNGAEEIDLVLNVCALKSGMDDIIDQELAGVTNVCHCNGAIVKLIIESPLLTEELIVKASQMAEKHGVDIVKTSTGFSAMLPRATSVEDVQLIRKTIKPTTGLKAAGGIRETADALAMVAAGATRLGASSGLDLLSKLDN